jgi:hypothetical protein
LKLQVAFIPERDGIKGCAIDLSQINDPQKASAILRRLHFRTQTMAHYS